MMDFDVIVNLKLNLVLNVNGNLHQARVAIRNMFLGDKSKQSDLLIPWCTYTEPEVAHVGKYEAELTQAGVEFESYMVRFFFRYSTGSAIPTFGVLYVVLCCLLYRDQTRECLLSFHVHLLLVHACDEVALVLALALNLSCGCWSSHLLPLEACASRPPSRANLTSYVRTAVAHGRCAKCE